MSSASLNKATKAKESREARAKAKEHIRNTVSPAIEPVLEEIKKEKERTILELIESIDGGTADEQVKSVILALNLYKESMDALNARLTNIMRVKE
jgi:methyl coenzyme M reductase gamma subunit